MGNKLKCQVEKIYKLRIKNYEIKQKAIATDAQIIFFFLVPKVLFWNATRFVIPAHATAHLRDFRPESSIIYS